VKDTNEPHKRLFHGASGPAAALPRDAETPALAGASSHRGARI
jgi:hypothetical protein